MGGKDQGGDVGQTFTHLRLHLLQLPLGGADGGAEVIQGQVGTVLGDGQRIVLPLAVQPQARAARQPTGSHLALEGGDRLQRRVVALAGSGRRTQQQARVLDRAGELGAHRAQPLHVHACELAVLAALHHEHADARDAAQQRHRQEALELLLPEVRDVAVEGTGAGHRLHDVAELLERHPGKPLAQLQAHLPHQLAVEPVGGAQGKLANGGVVEVDRAHLGIDVLGHHRGRALEERAQVERLVKQRTELADVADQAVVLYLH